MLKGGGKGWGKGGGKGLGKHHHGHGWHHRPGIWDGRHHHRPGPGLIGVAAEAAAVGALVGVVANVMGRRPGRPGLGRQQPRFTHPGISPSATQPSLGAPMEASAPGMPMQQAMPMQPPLLVASLQLPPAAIYESGGVTYYGVDFTLQGQVVPLRAAHRYNDFSDLEKYIISLSPGVTFPGTSLPGKTFGKCSGAKLEERRRGLEAWLRSVLAHPASNGLWAGKLRDFLMKDCIQVAGQELQIQMPAGISGGQVIAVTVPDGRQLPFVIPEGALPPPGSALRLWFDSTLGSLTLMAVEQAPDNRAASCPDLTGDRSDSISKEALGEALQIQVPPGVVGGQALAITVPDGRQITFVLPQNVTSGAELELWYDPASATLTPVG